MSNANQIEEAKMCFACGPDNPIGLQIRFTLADDVCSGEFRANENHVGYSNTVHGGIIFSALDDVMANVLYLKNIKAHTARCEIRYRRPLAVNESIFLKGWIDSQRKRLIVLRGEARLSDGTLVADCEASFMAA
ncbi:MAG: PaaI family thioesterase [Gammaproteobacteria bacterium]|nr:PaaI family thioesterase [Gammaproteobacteria bacterium]MDH4313687.1 PaaI family thioesterase [Gammaproteobacteria bacterium]MDH5214596.1 PaaI family thioesterase [Gammaproteobacteria bacterium]MDH5500751.1 PaaI family thioesterase [Gammaproteobacteria bacterium]